MPASSGGRKMPPGKLQGRAHAIRGWCNQFLKDDGRQPGAVERLFRPARLCDFTECGGAECGALPQAVFHGSTERAGHSLSETDDLADPVGEAHARLSQRLGQIAEFQVSMRVDQARNDGDVAQISNLVGPSVASDGHDSLAFDSHQAVGYRYVGDGKYESGFQCSGIGIGIAR